MSSFAKTAPHFLGDLCALLRESSHGSTTAERRGTTEDRDLALGRLMAYHEVMSLILEQATALESIRAGLTRRG